MNEHHNERHEDERDRPDTLHPRIWIGSLADYNAGRLHGDWIDAAVEDDELLQAARAVIASSPEPGAEEWGIFDFDEFGTYRVDEYDDLAIVARVARGIALQGPSFAAWADLVSGDLDRLDQYEEAFQGEYDTAVDWACEVLEDQTLEAELDRAIPDSLRPYVSIEYPAFVRDCELGGDIDIVAAPGGRVWVFRAWV